MDFKARKTDADFMAASPAACLPAIEDGEVRMMESVAIMEYLTARYGPTPLAPPPSDPGFPLYQQFLHYGEASLAAPLNVAIASRFYAPEDERENWGGRIAVQMCTARAKVLEAQLQTTEFVAGDAFTAADISCTYPLGILRSMGAGERLGPATIAYVERMRARPAYQRALRHTAPLHDEAG